MRHETSIVLDLMRFVAACTVAFGHLSGRRLTGGFLWQFGAYSGEAVTAFFVLSGLVIAYVVDTRERDAVPYAISRAARIYSVAVPALALTLLLDAVGSAASPHLYTASWGYHGGDDVAAYLSSLFFLNELWWRHVTPGSALPYWSLGFEVWYYVIFGVFVFAPRRWRWPAAAAVGVVMGPKIVLMLPIWLIGVATWRLLARRVVGARLGLGLCMGGIAGLVVYETLLRRRFGLDMMGPAWAPWLLQDYIVAPLFAAFILGCDAAAGRLAWLRRAERLIRWLAGATFSIYLVHLPLAQFLAAASPFPVGSRAGIGLIFLGTAALAFAFAQVTERRKDVWRRLFVAIAGRARPVPVPPR